MADAPERIWAHYGLASPKKGHIWGGWNAIRNDNLTEYVRADLYEAGQRFVDEKNTRLKARIAALEQERDELKELNRGVSQLWRDTMEREARLREAIREWESGATVACNLLSSPSGADRRHEVVSHLNRTHEKARALTEGENDG